MRAASAVFVLIATWAIYTCLASHLSAWQAVPLALALWALLTLCAVKHERAQPCTLTIGPDKLSAWGRTGSLLVQGHIAGCSQWSDRLLVLALASDRGRCRTLLLPVDALPGSAFRALAVLGRRCAGARL
jgi:hypothetical protein